jgi:hypothetical protein
MSAEQYVTQVGLIFMVAAGFFLAAALLAIAEKLTGKYAWDVWRNLTLIYQLNDLAYWFRRFRKEGPACIKDLEELP